MTDYSLRELECFLAVAEELSFTRAAERLRLAQPPLSRHIKQLEEKLGVLLFERSRRHVALTPAGRAFQSDARDVLLQLRRAGEAAKRAARGETDRLEVGFVSAVLSPELVQVFTRFREAQPRVQLNLHDLPPADQLAALERGNLDIGFVGLAPERTHPGLATTRWREEALMVFLPPGHRLSEKGSVRLADLSEEPFVSIASEAAPAYASYVNGICRLAGFRPRVVQEASRAQAVAALTVAGSGVAILPASLHRVTGNGVCLAKSRKWKTAIVHAVAHRAQPGSGTKRFLDVMRNS